MGPEEEPPTLSVNEGYIFSIQQPQISQEWSYHKGEDTIPSFSHTVLLQYSVIDGIENLEMKEWRKRNDFWGEIDGIGKLGN